MSDAKESLDKHGSRHLTCRIPRPLPHMGVAGTCLAHDEPAHQHLPKDPVQGGSLDAHLSASTLNLHHAHGSIFRITSQDLTFPWGPVIKTYLPRCADGLQAIVYKTLQGTMPNQTTCVQRCLIHSTT